MAISLPRVPTWPAALYNHVTAADLRYVSQFSKKLITKLRTITCRHLVSLQSAFHFTDMVLDRYIEDLDDADLLVRPGKGCNHLAWQTRAFDLFGSQSN